MASQLERHGLAICIYHIPCVPIKRLYYKPIIYTYIYIYRIYIGVCVCGISSHIYIPYYIFPYHTIYISPNIVYMVNQSYHINIYLVIYHVLYTYCHPPQKKKKNIYHPRSHPFLMRVATQRRGRCLVAHLGPHGSLPGAVQILSGRRRRFPWLNSAVLWGVIMGGYMVDINI